MKRFGKLLGLAAFVALLVCALTTAAWGQSNAAALTITKQPEDVTVWEYNTAVFTVAASEKDVTYQWQFSTNGGASWKDSTNKSATTATLRYSAKPNCNGRLFRCVVTGANGTATSEPAMLKIPMDWWEIIHNQPAGVAAAEGTTAVFTVAAYGDNLSYQWQYSTDGGENWKDSTNKSAKTATLRYAAQANYDGRLFRCVVTGAFGTVTSDSAPLLVSAADTTIVAWGACGYGEENECEYLSWNTIWMLTDDGVLTIAGTGDMDLWVSDGAWQRYYGQFERVVLKEGVRTIGGRAFLDCTSLTSVTIPSSVTSIEWYAFSGCSGLTSVTIPASVRYVGGNAFSDCSGLTSVTIPSGVTSIGSSMFSNCSGLTSVTIPSSVTSIGDSAFSGCTGLTSVTIPEGVTSIGGSAFSGCSGLTSVTIPSSVTSIGGSAFSGCTGPMSVTIKSGVTSIGSSMFSNCSGLTSVTIPDGVTIIRNSAFSGCAGLKSVMIPESVTSIESSAFKGCSSLTNVYYSGTQAKWYDVEIGSTNAHLENATIHYSAHSMLSVESQPADVTAVEGATAVFTVAASEEDVTYQWQFSTDGGASWKDSTNKSAKTATLRYSALARYNGRLFRCVVTGANGTATSDAAMLTISTPLTITRQPTDVTAVEGTTAAFTVAASEKDVTYQWQLSTNGGASWKDSTNKSAKTATLLYAALASYNGRLFRCVVTGATGTVTSEPATLTVSAAQLTITRQPADVTALEGTTAVFTVAASEENVTYQWQLSTNGGASWKDSTNKSAQTATMRYAAKASYDGRLFRCVVTGTNGTATSDAAMLTVIPPLSITVQPESVVAAEGTTAAFTVAASEKDVTYQWQFSTNGGASWKDSTNKSAQMATMRYAALAGYNGRLFRCVVTGANGTATSEPASLTVRTVVASGYRGNKLIWTLTDDGVLTIYADYDIDNEWIEEPDDQPWHNVRSEILSVVVKPGVEMISDNSFCNCDALKSVTIPASVGYIGSTAFVDCDRLQSIVVDADNAHYQSIDGVLFNRDYPTLGPILQLYPAGRSGAYAIPSGVTTIGGSAFSGCSGLTGVTLPVSVKNIYGGAFSGCSSLTDVYYPGTQTQWNAIGIKDNNGPLTSAAIHFAGVEIVTQPTNVTASAGTTVRFTVAASEEDVAYQWQYSTDGGETWTNSTFSSATAATLRFTAKAGYNGRLFRCVVTGANGTATSWSAALTVG